MGITEKINYLKAYSNDIKRSFPQIESTYLTKTEGNTYFLIISCSQISRKSKHHLINHLYLELENIIDEEFQIEIIFDSWITNCIWLKEMLNKLSLIENNSTEAQLQRSQNELIRPANKGGYIRLLNKN